MAKIIIDIPEDFNYTSSDTNKNGFIKAILEYWNYSCIWGYDKMENHIIIEN